MRKKISDMINSDRQCEVIATAHNGEEAVKGVLILKPDVVTLDVHKCNFNDNLIKEFLQWIESKCKTKIQGKPYNFKQRLSKLKNNGCRSR